MLDQGIRNNVWADATVSFDFEGHLKVISKVKCYGSAQMS